MIKKEWNIASLKFIFKNFKSLNIILLNFLMLIVSLSTKAQDSSRLQISLLTCTPGQDLYATFGHSALRVIDSSNNTDVVYNYGTFMFDEGFYLKFMRGKLDYFLSVDETSNFIHDYQYEKRGITEQVLNLTNAEKNVLYKAIKENSKIQNRIYKYDFFFDNCTTRLRDLLQKQKDSTLALPAVMPAGTTFRNAIHYYLDKGKMHWSKLGIDILLGYPCDAVMKNNQDGFLPFNLLKSLDSTNNKYHLVATEKDLYNYIPLDEEKTIFTPLFIFSLIVIAIISLGFVKLKAFQITQRAIIVFFYFLFGLLGILLIIMWTVTDHAMCRNNFNLLWAWPTHVVMAFFYFSKKQWVKKYFGINAMLMTILLLTWFFIPQKLNVALIPFVVMQLWFSWKKYYFNI